MRAWNSDCILDLPVQLSRPCTVGYAVHMGEDGIPYRRHAPYCCVCAWSLPDLEVELVLTVLWSVLPRSGRSKQKAETEGEARQSADN